MKRNIFNQKTIKKLGKRLYKMINKEYGEPDGFHCEITEVALSSIDGINSSYTIDVHYGFIGSDGKEIHRKIDDLIVGDVDGKIEIPFVAGQVSQYIDDHDF